MVLAAMGFDEIEFILLYTCLICGYMSIISVLFLNLLVSNMIGHPCPKTVSLHGH